MVGPGLWGSEFFLMCHSLEDTRQRRPRVHFHALADYSFPYLRTAPTSPIGSPSLLRLADREIMAYAGARTRCSLRSLPTSTSWFCCRVRRPATISQRYVCRARRPPASATRTARTRAVSGSTDETIGPAAGSGIGRSAELIIRAAGSAGERRRVEKGRETLLGSGVHCWPKVTHQK